MSVESKNPQTDSVLEAPKNLTALPPVGARPLLALPTSAHILLLVGTFTVLSALTTFAILSHVTTETQTAAAATSEEEYHVPMSDPLVDVEIAARAAYVLNVKSGKVIYQKNANEQLPLASLTKLALALVAAETLDPEITLPVSSRALMTEGDDGLYPGQSLSVRELLDLTLVTSSNDAATALAEGLSGPLHDLFPELAESSNPSVDRMNKRVGVLGLQTMYFVNVTGLDESATMSGGYGSARDVAKLLAHLALTYPQTIAGTAYAAVQNTATTSFIENTNAALPHIPGLIGGKTGYTDLAGGNLAVVFDAGINYPIAVVVLGSTYQERFTDVEKLVKAAQEAVRQ